MNQSDFPEGITPGLTVSLWRRGLTDSLPACDIGLSSHGHNGQSLEASGLSLKSIEKSLFSVCEFAQLELLEATLGEIS